MKTCKIHQHSPKHDSAGCHSQLAELPAPADRLPGAQCGRNPKPPRALVRRTLIPAVFLALPLLVAGCIGVLPFPAFSNQPTKGTKLRAQDTAFILVGSTTAAEVFAALGTNCLCDPRQRAVAFSWELPGGRGVWWAVSTESGGGGEFEWSRWRAFFVAFDTNNVVIATDTVHLSGGKSLHEQLEAWAKQHRASPDHIHPENFVAKNP